MKPVLLFLICLVAPPAAAAEIRSQFSAFEFFEVFDSSAKRAPNLPERVTFENVDVEEDKFRELLVGTWKCQLSCSGRPLRSTNTTNTAFADGVVKPSVTIHFLESSEFIRRLHKGLRQTLPMRFFDADILNGTWSVTKTDDGSFQVSLPGSYLRFLYLRVVNIKETGEHILLDDLSFGFDHLCEPGDTFRQIFTLIPEA